MIWTIRQLLLTVHILLAISWVGGVLFIGWGVFPAVQNFSYDMQRKIYIAVMKWSHWLLTIAGAGVIITGILLGTVFGPLHSMDDIWHTTYGNVWFIAFLLASIALIWGAFISYPTAMKVFMNKQIWEKAESGKKTVLKQALAKLMVIEAVEIILFVTIVYLMVLL